MLLLLALVLTILAEVKNDARADKEKTDVLRNRQGVLEIHQPISKFQSRYIRAAGQNRKRSGKNSKIKKSAPRKTCKQKPLQLKCVNSKFKKQLKQIQAKMRTHVGKFRMTKFEANITSQLSKATMILTNLTNVIIVPMEAELRNTSMKLNAALASLESLQANVSMIWTQGGFGNWTLGNLTVLEQLNATR